MVYVGTAHAEICRLLFAYAELLDDGDLDGLSALFTNATFRSQGAEGISTLTGSAEVLAAFSGSVVMHGGTPATQHATTNVAVDIDVVAGRASARSVFTVLQAAPGFALQVVVAGRYRDSFRYTPQGWEFADRLVHIRLVGDISAHLAVTVEQLPEPVP